MPLSKAWDAGRGDRPLRASSDASRLPGSATRMLELIAGLVFAEVQHAFTFLHPASDEDVSRGTGSRWDTPLLTPHNSCSHLFLLGLQVLAIPNSTSLWWCHHQFSTSYGSPVLAVRPLPSREMGWVHLGSCLALGVTCPCRHRLEAQPVRIHTSPISAALHVALLLLFHFLTHFVQCAKGFSQL